MYIYVYIYVCLYLCAVKYELLSPVHGLQSVLESAGDRLDVEGVCTGDSRPDVILSNSQSLSTSGKGKLGSSSTSESLLLDPTSLLAIMLATSSAE